MYLTDQSVFYRQAALYKIAFTLFSTRSRMNRDAVCGHRISQPLPHLIELYT